MNTEDETPPVPSAAPAPAADFPRASYEPPPSGPAPAPPRAEGPSRYEPMIEQVAREMLRERRRDRRWRLAVRLLWLGFFIALAWGLMAQKVHPTAPSGPHTALIEVRGEIAAEGEASAENIVAALKSAFDEKNAKAIVLRFNSPGGSPVQAGIVNDELRRLKALHPDKKVYSVVEEMCASGAYYMAVATDEIYVDKASIVGSIGVLMDGFGFTGAMDKLGVERRLLTAGANKGMLDPFSPLKPEQRALAQAMIDQIHQQFIKVVKQGRGNRLKVNDQTFSGLFWNGEEAVHQGLADKFGNLDYVAREVVKAEDVVDYTPKENVAERLAKRFGASIGEGAVHALQAAGRLR